jgi:hypothetical protein
MNSSFKNKLTGGVLSAVCLVAIAKTVGPFLVDGLAPGTTHILDRDSNYVTGGNIARHYLGLGVAGIKRGDHIRIVYSDGTVYDLEVGSNCSIALTVACSIVKATQRSSVDSKSLASSLVLKDMRQDAKDSCRSPSYRDVKTGYFRYVSDRIWEGGVQVVSVVKEWVDTGFETHYIQGGAGSAGCK